MDELQTHANKAFFYAGVAARKMAGDPNGDLVARWSSKVRSEAARERCLLRQAKES